MFRKSLLILSLVLFALCFPLVQIILAADPPAANPVGEAVRNLLINDVLPILGALLLGLVGVVLNKLRSRFNLQISAETQAYLESLAHQGITYAEEKAAAAVKSKVTKLTGQDKLDMAIAHIMNAAPKVSPEQAEKLVHSLLARVSGTGATGPMGG